MMKNTSSRDTVTPVTLKWWFQHLKELDDTMTEDQMYDVLDFLNNVDWGTPHMVKLDQLILGVHRKSLDDVLNTVKSKLLVMKDGAESQEQIKRGVIHSHKTLLALEHIKGNAQDVDDETKAYAGELVVLFNRLLNINRVRVIRDIDASEAVQATITSMIMSLGFEHMLDKEVTQALDLNSLIRLSIFKGGQTIVVPTYEEVEQVIASAYFYYLRTYEGLDDNKAQRAVRKQLDIDIETPILNKHYKVLTHMFGNELEDNSSIAETFKSLMTDLKALQVNLKQASANIESGDEFVKVYAGVNKAMLDLTRGLSKL